METSILQEVVGLPEAANTHSNFLLLLITPSSLDYKPDLTIHSYTALSCTPYLNLIYGKYRIFELMSSSMGCGKKLPYLDEILTQNGQRSNQELSAVRVLTTEP